MFASPSDYVREPLQIVAVNVVPDSGLFAGQAIYDCGPLQLQVVAVLV
jgi:hypothetical protein